MYISMAFNVFLLFFSFKCYFPIMGIVMRGSNVHIFLVQINKLPQIIDIS